MKTQSKCKICRRFGTKLFLRGERCFSPKCAITRRGTTPPGQPRKKVRGGLTEYGKAKREKQKLRNLYHLSETQFRNYVKEILAKKGKELNLSYELFKKLEKRLDNIVFKLGFSSSRRQAKQIVSHGFFTVNKKSINIPSYQVKKGELISLKESKRKGTYFKNLSETIKKVEVPTWLSLDKENYIGEIKEEPIFDEKLVAEIPTIIEFYSRR